MNLLEDKERSKLLSEDNKETLVDEILQLRREVRELKEKLEKLTERDQSQKATLGKAHKHKKRWKKLGAPVSHPGCTRPKPEAIKLNRILNDAYRLNEQRPQIESIIFSRRLYTLNTRLLRKLSGQTLGASVQKTAQVSP